MMELPTALQQALDERRGQPLSLTDPRTGRIYLLVPADVFERIDYAEDEPILSSLEVGLLIARNMKEDDEDDPTLESYQRDERPQ